MKSRVSFGMTDCTAVVVHCNLEAVLFGWVKRGADAWTVVFGVTPITESLRLFGWKRNAVVGRVGFCFSTSAP